MRIKIHATVKGIPKARVAVAGGEENDAKTVNTFISAVDSHDMPTVVASLRMTPDEAIEFAARLVSEANRAKEGT